MPIKTVAELREELRILRKSNDESWATYGSEMCPGDMIRREQELVNQIAMAPVETTPSPITASEGMSDGALFAISMQCQIAINEFKRLQKDVDKNIDSQVFTVVPETSVPETRLSHLGEGLDD
jgi:hypothetical protein